MLLSLVFTLVYLSTLLVVPLIGTREALLSVWTLGDCFLKSPSLLDAVAYGRSIGSVLRVGVLDVGLGNATALLAGSSRSIDISSPLRHGLVALNANLLRVGLFVVVLVVLGALAVLAFFPTANMVNEHLAVHNALKQRQPLLLAEEDQTSRSITELYHALTAHQSEVQYWRDANKKLDDDVVSLKATVVQVKANHDAASATLAAATTARSDAYQRWKAAQEHASSGEKKREEELSRAQSLTDTLRREFDAILGKLRKLKEREALCEQACRHATEQVVTQIDDAQASIIQKKAELAEGAIREKGLRGEIVEGKAQIADTLKKVSDAQETVTAAEQEVVDEEKEYEVALAAKIKQLQSLEVALSTAKDHEDSMTARKVALLAEFDGTKQAVKVTKDDFNTVYTAAESNLATMQRTLEQRTGAIDTIRIHIASLESSCADIAKLIKDTETQLAATVAAASSAASEVKNIIKGRLSFIASLEAEVRSLRRMHSDALKTTTIVRTELAEVEKRCTMNIAKAKRQGDVAKKLHQRKLEKINEEKRRLDRYLHQLSADLEATKRRRTQLEQELANTNTQIEEATPYWEQTHSEVAEKDAERWAARDILQRDWTDTCATRDAAKAIADRDDTEATHAEESAKQDIAALEDMRAAFCTTLAGLRSANDHLTTTKTSLSAEIKVQNTEAAKMDDAIQELPTLHAERMEAMSDRLDALEEKIRRARAARRSSGALRAAEADFENAQDTLLLMTMTADGLEAHLKAARGTQEDAAGMLVGLENG